MEGGKGKMEKDGNAKRRKGAKKGGGKEVESLTRAKPLSSPSASPWWTQCCAAEGWQCSSP